VGLLGRGPTAHSSLIRAITHLTVSDYTYRNKRSSVVVDGEITALPLPVRVFTHRIWVVSPIPQSALEIKHITSFTVLRGGAKSLDLLMKCEPSRAMLSFVMHIFAFASVVLACAIHLHSTGVDALLLRSSARSYFLSGFVTDFMGLIGIESCKPIAIQSRAGAGR
jgi:hypothetical protein